MSFASKNSRGDENAWRGRALSPSRSQEIKASNEARAWHLGRGIGRAALKAARAELRLNPGAISIKPEIPGAFMNYIPKKAQPVKVKAKRGANGRFQKKAAV
jgi:hypothetical protein